MRIRYAWFGIAAGLLASLPLQAQSLAFFSTQGSNAGVQVLDVCSMEVQTRITGVGTEPSRMVRSPDGSRIFLSSASGSSGSVYAIDVATRQVVESAAAGIAQNRTIAISPDGSRVYTWKVTSSTEIGVLVLDANDLSEIATVPITGSNCVNGRNDVFVMPDGRIIANACNDGLRIIDPQTLAVGVGPTLPTGSGSLLGTSPDGVELYVSRSGALGVAANNTGVRAIDLATGVASEFTWSLPPAGSFPGFASGAGIRRLSVVKVPGASLANTYYYATYLSAGGVVPIAYARASDLVPGPGGTRNRRMIGLVAISGATSLGSANGRLGFATAGLNAIRRLRFDPEFVPPANHVTAAGSAVSFTGTSTLTDVIVFGDGELFCDGYEP
ncbi:MAG: YncE family protein [Xanthomonadaceae bacterium]|jgi:DNA-binding beta-propeller fold protein YncE|nr:YncE family protein [Xanthomonadaceae bacterium]